VTKKRKGHNRTNKGEIMSTDHEIARRTFLSASLAAVAVGAAACGFGGGDDNSGDNGDNGNNNATGGGSTESGGTQPTGGQSSGGGSSDPSTTTFSEAWRPINDLNMAFNAGPSPDSTVMQCMLWEGLIRHDPTDSSKYLPGVAEKWEVSPDGKTYTFHLRDGLKWSNGDPLTADDFVWTWSYYYDSAALGKLGSKYPVAHSVKEADITLTGLYDYFTGKTTDFSTVGMKAPDPKTIVFTLNGASFKFFDGLVPVYPLHKKSVMANQLDYWMPGKIVCNGPYKLTAYKQNGNAIVEKNANYWDAASYSVTKRNIQFNASGSTGMMISYNSNEIDIFRVDGDPTALIAGRSDIADQLQHAALTQYKGVTVMPNKNPILRDNIKLRQALAMAIDRDALAKVSAPDVAAPSWVPSGIADSDKLPKIPYDVKAAQQLLSDAGFPGGKGVPKLQILTYDKMPVLEAVASMWKSNLGITTSVSVQEVGVYSSYERGDLPEDFVGFVFNYIAPRPFNMMIYGTQYTFRVNTVPYDIWKQIYAIQYGSDKNKYTPADASAKVLQLTEDNFSPDYKNCNDLNTQAMQQDAAGQADAAAATAIKAATALQETYYYIPLLWSGYTFMVKPRIHNLVLTSYPYEIFSLKGVTLDPKKK
jgi:ABC-type transport system substrate-binding protein